MTELGVCYQEADHVLEFSLSLQVVELDVIKVSGDVCWCEAQVPWCVAYPWVPERLRSS